VIVNHIRLAANEAVEKSVSGDAVHHDMPVMLGLSDGGDEWHGWICQLSGHCLVIGQMRGYCLSFAAHLA
jgi:hypothetical protein